MADNQAPNKGHERPFEPRVLRSAANGERYWWVIRSGNGQIVESSHMTYSSKADALRAANAIARAMQRGLRRA